MTARRWVDGLAGWVVSVSASRLPHNAVLVARWPDTDKLPDGSKLRQSRHSLTTASLPLSKRTS